MTALGDMLTPAHRIVGIGPEAIFYLHGVGGDRTSFDAQIGAGGPGFAHIAWDMPGYGDSAALPEMTFAALAEAALRLIDALHIERAHLVGHSMGGMIAQELVASHPDRVASLVLSATSPAFGKAGGDWQQEFLAARLAPLDEGKTPADLAPAIVEALVADGADGTDGADETAKAAAIEAVDAMIPRLAALRADVVVVTGDHSTPALLGAHSWHHVPVLLASDAARPTGVSFSESEARRGDLGVLETRHLMSLMLAHAGRLRKFGA